MIAEDRKEDKYGRRIVPRGDDAVAVLERTLTQVVDYPQLIMQQIRACQIGALCGDASFGKAVSILVAMIPDQDMDEAFLEDYEKTKTITVHHTGEWTDHGGLRRMHGKIPNKGN